MFILTTLHRRRVILAVFLGLLLALGLFMVISTTTPAMNAPSAPRTVFAPTLSINDVTVVEGNSGLTNAVFTVTLTDPSGDSAPVTVNYATVTQPGGDFVATSGTLTFPYPVGGPPPVLTINVPINGDLTVEGNETFTVMLSNPSGATITKANGIGVISNDDTAAISITDVNVIEGNSGTASAVFQISLSAPADQPISITAATADGTAKAGSGDYVADAGRTITFTPGSVGPLPYAVTINGDTTDEADETFTVNLTASGFPYANNAVTIADNQGLGIIRDDDPDAGSVLVFPYYTSSPDGTNDTILSMYNSRAREAMMHLYVISNTCAQTDVFVTLPANGCTSLSAATFAPGETGYVIAVAIDDSGIPIQNNSFSGRARLRDGDYVGSYDAEVFRANSPTPVTFHGDGTGTLHFDSARYDQVPSQFTVSIQSPVDIGGQKVVTAGMQGSPIVAGGLTGAGQVGPGIVTSSTGRLASFTRFLAGTCQSISTVSLTNPRVPGGMGFAVPSGQTGVLNFRIDGGVGLMLTPQTAPGGAKIQPLQKTNFTNTTLTIPIGVTTSVANLPSLSINDVAVPEGNGPSNAVFTVTLENAQFGCAPVTVNYAVPVSSGGDYVAVSGTLTFAPPTSGTTVTQTITVPVYGDFVVEGDEPFVVTLSGATGATIAKAEGLGTISNDDIAAITISDAFSFEGLDGITNIGFQVTMNAFVDQPVVVSFATADGSATVADNDYLPASGTVTFPANSTGVQIIQVAVRGDAVPEINETFGVQLMPNAVPYTAVSILDPTGMGMIANDDINTCPTATGTTVPVAGDLTTTYSLVSGCGITMATPAPPPPPSDLPSGYTLNDTTVAYEVTTTAPYAGPIVLTFKVPLSVTEEQFARLRVLHGENGEFEDRTILAPDSPAPNFATREISARVTSLSPFIIAVAPLNSLSISDVNLNEGNAGTVNANFTVSLSNPSASAVTVQYQTADGTATAGSDYTALPLTTLTFNPGEQSKTITVSIKGDTTVEAIENFFVNLSNASGATLAKSQGVGTIMNDDTTALSINDVSVTEGNAGTVNANFTVSLSNPSASTVTVQYQTVNDTATAPRDFVAVPLTTLTFNPNEQSKTITVVVNGETAVEPNESFFVNLSNAVGVTIADAQGVGRITNDDGDLPLLRVRAADPAVCLGPGGLIGITAAVTNPNAAAVTATWTATLPAPLLGLPGSGTATVNAPAMQVTTTQASWTGTLNAGQTVTFTYQAQIAAGTALDTQFCLQNKAQFNGGYEVVVPECFVANCPTLGLLPLANTRASDQKAGSLLVFPYYTSNRATRADTRLTISNVSMQTINTHVFFLDGATCSPADMFLCLTPGASFSFKASEYDPENTGFMYVVAVDVQGRPIQSNGLVGNAFVNEGEYYDTYGAVAFERYDNGITQPNGTIALLSLNGTIYDAAPVQFAVEIQSPLDVIGQRIIVAPIAGDLDGTATLPAAHPTLQTAATQLGIGLAINGQEKATSFSALLSGGCLKTATLSATYPRVPGGLSGLIGKGATGHLQFRVGAGVGLLMTPRAGANHWSGIRGLHQTATSNVVLVIPVIAPAC